MRNRAYRRSNITMSELARKKPDFAARYPEFAPPGAPIKPVFDVMTLTPLQMAALLSMHESVVRRAVVRKLLEDSQDCYRSKDFIALRDLALCEPKAGKREDQLTAAGISEVRKLERELCTRFGIHVLIDQGNTSWQRHFKCTCGQWNTAVRHSHTAPGNARVAFNGHLATVEGMSALRTGLRPIGMEESA